MNREEHLLTILSEECAEVIKDVSKALRFGLDDYPPDSTKENTNKKRIAYELNDIIAVAQMLKNEQYIDNFMDSDKILEKQHKVEEFLLYSKDRNKLT